MKKEIKCQRDFYEFLFAKHKEELGRQRERLEDELLKSSLKLMRDLESEFMR